MAIRPNFILGVSLAVSGLGLLLWGESAVAASRVNVMPDRQVRPGASLPVFGNAGNGGAIGNGSATGETYTWEFAPNANVTVTDDGSLTGTVGSDRNIVENVTFGLVGSTREIVVAQLTVDDGNGGIDSDVVRIDVVDPTDPISSTALQSLQIEVNIAIEDAMRALYLAQQSDGRWRHNPGFNNTEEDCATTGFTIWGFANSAHPPTNDIDDDIYAEFVQQGVDFVLGLAQEQAVILQANIGDPDGDGNERILSLCGPSNFSPNGYANPIATAGIIAAYSSPGAPGTLVAPGSFAGQVPGDTYFDVVQDLIDWIAYAQHDTAGITRGGWRYTANGGADTSADSWHFVAMDGFEVVFGGTVLELVKQEAELRINSSQSQGGAGDLGQFGYVDTFPLRFDGNATTAGGLSGLVMTTAGGRTPTCLNGAGACTSLTFPDAQSRKDAAVAHLGLRWDHDAPPISSWEGNRNNFYAMWTTARALRLNNTEKLVDKNGVTFEWQTGVDDATPGVLPPDNDVHEGYFPWLVRMQNADGTWPATVNTFNWTSPINTAWGLLVLQPTVFGEPQPDEIEVVIDVMYLSNPDIFICRRPGEFLQVTVFGQRGFDVTQIDLSTVRLTIAPDSEPEEAGIANGPEGLPALNHLICDRGNPEDAGRSGGDLNADCRPDHFNLPDKLGGELDGILDIDFGFSAPKIRNLGCQFEGDFRVAPERGLIVTGKVDGKDFFSVPVPDVGIDQLVLVRRRPDASAGQ